MPGKSEDILGGFRVNWMNLRDADTGKILWQVYYTILAHFGNVFSLLTILIGLEALESECCEF